MVRISTSETIMIEGARRFLTANFMFPDRFASRYGSARRRGGPRRRQPTLHASVIKFREKIGHEGFHLDREHFHLLRKVNESDQTRYGNAQSENRRAQRLGDAQRYLFGVGRTGAQAEAGKNVDQTGNRSD